MKRKEKKKMGAGSIIFMALVYLFLYMPVFVIILFSFNKNNTNMVFDGFTLKWYLEVLPGTHLLRNFWLSIELALVVHGHIGGSRNSGNHRTLQVRVQAQEVYQRTSVRADSHPGAGYRALPHWHRFPRWA